MTMPRGRLEMVASTFNVKSEALHNNFLRILSDAACHGCSAAGFAEAILTAWLQEEWGRFTRELVTASAPGTRRAKGNSVRPVSGARSPSDANKMVSENSSRAAKKLGYSSPVWHSPLFAVEVGRLIGLQNLGNLEVTLGSTPVPRQVSHFRNYLVHPSQDNRSKYEKLQATFGLHGKEPEDFLHQQLGPGVTVFTYWVRALQTVSYAATQ